MRMNPGTGRPRRRPDSLFRRIPEKTSRDKKTGPGSVRIPRPCFWKRQVAREAEGSEGFRSRRLAAWKPATNLESSWKPSPCLKRLETVPGRGCAWSM